MEPPPAPISIMSIEGTSKGIPLPSRKRYMRLTSKLPVTSGFLSSIRQALAVVPPMSNDISRSSPSSSANQLAASAPAAGPLSIMRTGLLPATAAPITPPELSMISGRFGAPIAARRLASPSR